MMERIRQFSRTVSWSILALVILAIPTWAAPQSKVTVCHIPPANPDNFHTITVGSKALAAHLAHGDLSGPCNDFCETLCDDGDACTIDACDPKRGCTYLDVDCDDGNECTDNDSCDPQLGCLNEPLEAKQCDDGNFCTISDTCDASGTCVGESVDGCCVEASDCNDGRLCTEDSCIIAPDEITGTCVNAEIACESPDLCSTATCDERSGECTLVDIACPPLDQCHESGICDPASGECSNPVKPDGASCDDGDPDTEGEQCLAGLCTDTVVAGGCPCATEPGWLSTVDFLVGSDGCNSLFFPQTFFVNGVAGAGAGLAIYNFGEVICQWQVGGAPLATVLFETSLADFESCRAIMTCQN